MNITITGSIAFDYLMSFPGLFTDHLVADRLHQVSLSFLVDSMRRQRGGTAPNIAYTLGLLGGNPTIMATAGQDFGEYRAWLEKFGVDTSGIVEIADDYCASFFVNTDQQQNQIASFYTGAMAHARELHLIDHVPDAELVVISPNDPQAMSNLVQECKERKIGYVYDPSQQSIRLTSEELIAGIDGCFLLTVNSYELGMIMEKTHPSEVELRAMANAVLVTNGAQGSQILVGDESHLIPSVPPTSIVEPTGAGDAYRAGLLRGIQLNLPWDISGRIGALCASYVLEQVGPQNHHFSPESFVKRFREHFNDAGALDKLLT